MKPICFSFLLLLSFCLGCRAQQPPVLPSWALGPFTRPQPVRPVITPDPQQQFPDPMSGKNVAWMGHAAFNPAAIVKDGKIQVLFRAEDNSGVDKIGAHTSRIGRAESTDGINMKIYPAPVCYPGNDDQREYDWPGGCEDPRVAVTEKGLYVMLYTSWNQKTPRLSVATSTDLVHWVKHGPAFKTAWGGRFRDVSSKSASIVTQPANGQLVIAKVNGKYLMYWGEYFVNPAVSDDLINWTPVLDDKKELLKLIAPRKGYFDSDLTECGPPALVTGNGILLLYNGKNAPGAGGDTRYPSNSYCAGQVLFDKKDPTRVIGRLDQPFLYPTEPFERSGQYAAGTVFLEGLVFYKEKWFLYYGCADSRVGVALYDPKKR
ncbi:glycoside hydrolase family 130 protein [Niabella beijingensis]|uniref:glycoside hydrolase family 130 protein n=1 Tax=Niabella beijingensis TaxID=2872700 RepID=UPI001CBE9AFC|nr:glycoside hydrolase family 130 protein [Niabella beijingensis]MBZ4192465.1 glycoside hydrolase family 130 protein [Niabella beijingensis]